MTHLHWLVYAYDGHSHHQIQGDQLTGVVSVDVLCETQAEALARAESLIPGKAFYEVRTVIEHEDHPS